MDPYVILFAVVFLIGLVIPSSGRYDAWMRRMLLVVLALIALVVETGSIIDPISSHSMWMTGVMFVAFLVTGLIGEMFGITLRKSGYYQPND